MTDDPVPTQAMVERYLRRTGEHIDRVRGNLEKVASHPEYAAHAELLRQRGLDHDRSKFSEEELLPKVWFIESRRCRIADEPFSYPPGMLDRIAAAERLHLAGNRHHPESHADVNDMSDVDIIEMVCDWSATAAVSGDGSSSALAWAQQCIGSRYLFNDERQRVIFEIIQLLDAD